MTDDEFNSRQKIRLGRTWQNLTGRQYRYFMVFETNDFNEDGTYTIDNFIPILKDM